MRNLFRYLLRNHIILIFLLLEAISVYMIVNYNNYHNVKFANSANYVSGTIYQEFSKITDFFKLSKVNAQLAEENARLKTSLEYYSQRIPQGRSFVGQLPSNAVITTFLNAKVINNSTNKQYNYLTLDKGSIHGVKQGQGVAVGNSVVGLIVNVSESYSVALSLLNSRWSISAKLKSNNYFGTVTWEGDDYRYAQLKDIPFHVPLIVRDTIVTSGFSSIFPEGFLIGTIEEFDKRAGGSFYNVKVKIDADFRTLMYVNIISNPGQAEINALERAVDNE